ncbi:MAG: hypothetical protein V3S01_03985, partial [Dehalococcoidia bacterium]
QPTMCELLLLRGADVHIRNLPRQTALSGIDFKEARASKHPWRPATLRVLQQAASRKAPAQGEKAGG